MSNFKPNNLLSNPRGPVSGVTGPPPKKQPSTAPIPIKYTEAQRQAQQAEFTKQKKKEAREKIDNMSLPYEVRQDIKRQLPQTWQSSSGTSGGSGSDGNNNRRW